ncbi:hypothetical protein ACMFMG_000406 [Clarireedia jacksonii]
MPRTLPWKTGGASARLRITAASSSRPLKRARGEKDDLDDESDEDPSRLSRSRAGIKDPAREPSTSPPPEPPPETFMIEGPDHDDKYRMVEDEFLFIAKKFTVHLHTAEYKRQEKMVKSRNADTINSISRPVVGKMQDPTKRKVEAIARAAKQRSTLESLTSKKPRGGEDESDDDETLPYVGTSIHGLMASPKGKSVSLTRITSPSGATRAAAGFRRPSSRHSLDKGKRSPIMKKFARDTRISEIEEETASETDEEDYDEDDLDAPTPAPSFRSAKLEKKQPVEPKLSTTDIKQENPVRPPVTKQPAAPVAQKIPEPRNKIEAPPPTQGSANRDRIAKRLEQARLRKKQEEQKKKLDVVPTFL